VGVLRCLLSVKKPVLTTGSTFHAFPAPSGMKSTITEPSLNKGSNDVPLAAMGAVKVLAADDVRHLHWLQGAQVHVRDITFDLYTCFHTQVRVRIMIALHVFSTDHEGDRNCVERSAQARLCNGNMIM
jgi:hypothetical protein